jgi:phosphoribosylformimino-5-aminoimidazole carboxamide ribotide isomerase
MLIPSIDLMGGRIVLLVQGETRKLSLDDFDGWMERLRKYPLVQVIDLDAARRQGENRELMETICKRLPCQVGGGLRSAEEGRRLLDAGARRVIYGSSLFYPTHDDETVMNGAPGSSRRHKLIELEFAAGLKKALGEDALCFAVDAKNGRVGRTEMVDLTPEEAVTWLEDYCAAFLYTHVDAQETMQRFPMDVAAILRATTGRELIVAGGIRERGEVEALDAMGVDAVCSEAMEA